MSRTTALGVMPDHAPAILAEFRNAHGWAPSIWSRLLGHEWFNDDAGLNALWKSIGSLPEWKQAALVLTFDTGVVPFQAFDWAAEHLIEFDARLPAPDGHVNHVPAMAALLATMPEVPLFGVYGTSVSENPFDPWDEKNDAPGNGIPLSAMYVLERHRSFVPDNGETE